MSAADAPTPPVADPPPEVAGSPARRRWPTVLKWLALAGVLGFVGYALVGQFRQIDWATLEFRAVPVLLATVLLVGVSGVQMISYRALLGAYADAPDWRAMAAVAWIPPLGKYVPGKVAALLGAMFMLRRFGVPAGVAVSVVLVLDGLAVIAGLVCASPILAWEPVRRWVPGAGAYAVAVVAAGVVCLHPAVFGRLVNAGLRVVGRPPLPKMPSLRAYAVPVACAFAQWLLAGLALWWMTRSVAEVEVRSIGLFISIAALAMTVSYLALFAPGGLGVREAIFLAALSAVPGVGAKGAVVVALMRLAQTAVELGLAGVGWRLLPRGAPAGDGAASVRG